MAVRAAVRFSALGDIATTIPYLRMLKNPLIVTSKMGYELLKDEFDEFFVIDPKKIWDRWRARRRVAGMEVYDFQNNRKSRSITKSAAKLYDNSFIPVERIVSRPIYESYEEILRRAGIEVRPDYTFTPKPKDYIVLNTGSSPKWRSKRLPAHKWREFSEVLWERYGLPFVLTGDKNEAEYVQQLSRHIVGKKEVIAGKTTIGELKRVLDGAYMVVSTDSAPMHIAAVQKTPTIGLFGATNFIMARPWGPWSVALYDKKLFAEGKPFEKNQKAIGNYYEGIDINEGLEALARYVG